MINLKEIFLYKLQGTNNMAYSTASSQTLSATDLAEVLKGSSVEPDIAVEPIEIVAGGFDQYPAVPGKYGAKGTLKFAMNPASGTTSQVLPQWGKVLQGSCDFAVAQTVAGTVAGTFVLTPSNTPTDSGLIDHYTGDAASNSALLSRYFNMKGSWKISMQANKVPTIEYPVQGAFHSESDATQPASTDIAAAKARETSRALKNAVIAVIGSSAYKVTSFEFDGSEAVVNRDDISQPGGAGQTDITDRKIKFTIKCYATTKAVADPLVALQNATQGAISVAWGDSAPKIITIGGTYAQITGRTKTDENGITAFDIKGQMNRNDFTVRIN